MTEPQNHPTSAAPRWRRPETGFAAAATLLILLGRFDLALGVAATGFLLLHRETRQMLSDSGQRRMILPMLLLLGLGFHLIDEPRRTYPLVPWDMYQDASPPRGYVAFPVTYASGREAHMPFELLSASPSTRAFSARFSSYAENVARLPEVLPQRRKGAQSLGSALLFLAQTHNARYPDDPITSVGVEFCRVFLEQTPSGSDAVPCNPFLVQEIPR
jgi:hypothetical protein